MVKRRRTTRAVAAEKGLDVEDALPELPSEEELLSDESSQDHEDYERDSSTDDDDDDDDTSEEEEDSSSEEEDSDYGGGGGVKKRKKAKQKSKQKKNKAASSSDRRKRRKIAESSSDDDQQEDEEDQAAIRRRQQQRQRVAQLSSESEDSDDEPHPNAAMIATVEELPFGEDLVIDDADRLKLDAMPEVERERIFYERGEQLRKYNERLQAQAEAAARGDAAAAEKAAKRQKKKVRSSTAAAAASRTSKKKTGKQKAREALDVYAKARKGRNIRKEQSFLEEDEEGVDIDRDDEEEEMDRHAKKQLRATKRKKSYQEESEESSSEGEGADEDEKRGPIDLSVPTTRTPVTLAHLTKIQLRRAHLERVLEEPYFNDFVKETFVRVAVGQRTTGDTRYIIAEVVSVIQGERQFAFGKRRDETRLLVLAHGRAHRPFPLDRVSNHGFTQHEFDVWKRQMRVDKVDLPTKEEVMVRKKKTETLRTSYVYTLETVKGMIESRRKGFSGANVAKERSKLLSLRTFAENDGDVEKLVSIDAQLEELSQLEARARERRKAVNQSVDIAKVNARNIEKNTADIDRLLMNERAAQRKAGVASDNQQLDPFRRRATRPALSWRAQTSMEDDDEEGTAKGKKKEVAESGTGMSNGAVRMDIDGGPSLPSKKGSPGLKLRIPVSVSESSVPLTPRSRKVKMMHALNIDNPSYRAWDKLRSDQAFEMGIDVQRTENGATSDNGGKVAWYLASTAPTNATSVVTLEEHWGA